MSELFTRPNGVAPRDIAAPSAGPASARVLADQLFRQFAELGHTRCLLLTGPAILQTFSAEALDVLRAAGATVEQIPLRPDRIGPAYWPFLIELDLEADVPAQACRAAVEMALQDWQAETLKRALGHRIGGFLLSAQPMAKIVGHLSGIAVQQRSDQPGQRLLAFSDPAAFEGLWRLCTTAQRRRLLGPVALWRTLGRWGEWADQQADAAIAPAEPQAEEPKRRLLGLDNEQWTGLFHVRAINRAWARAHAEGHTVSREDFERLPDSLQRAHGYGLGDTQDLEQFAWHALWAGTDFDLHPRVQALLLNRPPTMRYGRAVADLEDADWAEIRVWRQPAQTSQPWSKYGSTR